MGHRALIVTASCLHPEGSRSPCGTAWRELAIGSNVEAERQGLLSITERLLCARHCGGVSHGFPSGRHSHGLHVTAKKPDQGLSSWPKCTALWSSEGAFLQTQRGLEAEGRAVRALVRGGLGVWSLEAGSCRRVAQRRLKGQDNHRVDLAFPWVSLPERLPAAPPGNLPSRDRLYRAPRWSLPICSPLITPSSSRWARSPRDQPTRQGWV